MTTSELAYHKIKETGLLSKRQLQVYEALYEFGPMTGRKLSEYIPGAWKRLSELAAMGAVSSDGLTTDPVTGHKVALYSVTTAVPIKPDKPRSRRELIQEISELRYRLFQYETGVI